VTVPPISELTTAGTSISSTSDNNDPVTDDNDQSPRSLGAEVLIVLIGCTLLVLTGIIAPNFLTSRSRDAVINANPITIRTPITGTLQSLPKSTGLEVQQDQELAVIRNTNTNRDQLERLRTELQAARSRQADLRGQELAQRRLLAAIKVDAERQRALEIRRNRQDLLQTTADLRRAQAALAFAKRETKSIEVLFRTGVLAANVYDRARTTEQERHSELAVLEARLLSGRTDLEAATNNLVLRTNRSGSDPAVRLQETKRSLQSLQGELYTQGQRVEGLERQLAAASQEWEKRHLSVLRSPRHAVIWELQAQAGDLLEAMQPVIKLIDCGNRWVTTYVAENDLNRLRIGSAARVELVGRRLTLRGEVQSIRSGIGRLRLGEAPLVPLPINLARESEVRVRILNDVPAPPLQFCYVGYTGRVIF